METNERSGASAPGRIEIFPEFGPEQTIFELREAKKKTVLENIDEALRFAFELGYKAAELNIGKEEAYQVFKNRINDPS